jgi:hypothetical protein
MSQEDVKRLERELQRQGREVFVVEKKKTEPLWAAIPPGRYILASLVHRTRSEAIKAAVEQFDPPWSWEQLRRNGWRAERVRVFVEESPDA